MFIRGFPAVLLTCVCVLATIDIRRGGWLDRVVQYQKMRFLNELDRIAPVKINASIIPEPPGYKDSDSWDFDSVSYLLVLIRESDAAAPVHHALRRAMRPTRRIMMSMAESFKHFPSLSKHSMNEFYYDVGSAEDYPDVPQQVEQGVIVVTNPVEARLPSAQISIKLLKDILIQRAIAARQMPSTTASTIPWVPMNKTYTPYAGGAGGDAGGDATGDGGATGDGDATTGAGGAGGDDGTAAADGAGDDGGADGATTAGGEDGAGPAQGDAAETTEPPPAGD